jgi:hypothetical protein
MTREESYTTKLKVQNGWHTNKLPQLKTLMRAVIIIKARTISAATAQKFLMKCDHEEQADHKNF